MLPDPRPVVHELADVTHGALDFAELECLGLDPGTVLDFSVNNNPYGPSPAVKHAMAQVRFDRYPDRESLALRRLLADHLSLAPERILVGNGSMELVWLVAMAFLRPGDTVLIVQPTFGEYLRAAHVMGAQVRTYTCRPEMGFQVDADAVLRALQQLSPRLVFVCNPNNPTGTYLPIDIIAAWAEAVPQTLFVVDEAYLAFAPDAVSILTAWTDNILVLRSMTKDYALAGIRLGYAVGHADVLQFLCQVRPPWSVNALAQAAGIAALKDAAYLDYTLLKVGHAARGLVQGLQGIGLDPRPSTTHFFLLPVGPATRCRQTLLQQHGLLVRDCTSFGLPAYIRVATRRPTENDRLIAALAQWKPYES
jgi:histidinol-phosphate aminotransferase